MVDRAVTGDGDGTMKEVAADATEVETTIAEVLDVVEAGGLVTMTTMKKASHHCRRPREMVDRTGHRPRRVPA